MGTKRSYEPDSDDSEYVSKHFRHLKANNEEVLRKLYMECNLPTQEELDDVRREVLERSRRVFDRWNHLVRIVERHEAVIRDRWSKKGMPQAQRILKRAWEDIPRNHRPDVEDSMRAWKNIPKSERPSLANALRQKKNRVISENPEVHKWPMINLEDLSGNRKLLLVFLNARARNPPCAFVGADSVMSSYGPSLSLLKFREPEIMGHMMVFRGRHTPETYGELVPWGGKEEFWENIVYIHSPVKDGLIILEIQEHIYDFLVKCCQGILHDKSAWELEQGPIKPEPEPLPVAPEKDGVKSLAAVAAEAHYRLPAKIDLDRLEKIVAGKRSDAEDFIWSLREDPQCFAEEAWEIHNHRREWLRNKERRYHPRTKESRKDEFWDRILRQLIEDAYTMLAIWDELHTRIVHFRDLKVKYVNEIDPDKMLPSELHDSLMLLYHAVKIFIAIVILRLKHNFPCSHGNFKVWYTRKPRAGKSLDFEVNLEHESILTPIKKLVWMFDFLFDPDEMRAVGPDFILDEVDYQINNNREANASITSRVAGMISDVSILSECWRQINLFQPWFGISQSVSKSEEQEEEYRTRLWSRVQMLSDLMVLKDLHLADLGNPTTSKFRYPVDKRRTQDTNQIMQRAERNLDLFWERVDQFFIARNDIELHESLRRLFSDNRVLRRTPNWVEKPKASTPASTGVADNTQGSSKPLSQLYFNQWHTAGNGVEPWRPMPVKIKIKTRGEPGKNKKFTAAAAAEQLVQGGNRPDDEQPVYIVDKRTSNVMDSLFFVPSRSGGRPGEVNWNDFTYAMVQLGFEVEKLYGSVWQFSLEGERSIQFHDPHPDSKIPWQQARRHGRRLYRTYGWHRGMFVQV